MDLDIERIVDHYADDLQERSITVDDVAPCFVCMTPTGVIEVNYETRLCSPACLAVMDRRADEAGVIWTGKA